MGGTNHSAPQLLQQTLAMDALCSKWHATMANAIDECPRVPIITSTESIVVHYIMK